LEEAVLIDCDACTLRGPGCPDCVVSVLLGSPSETLVIDDDEKAAFDALAQSGLVPPLRLLHAVESREPDSPGAAATG
jgi:hypothetical protein